ncbi:MAG: helix-turn-helix transcriptional regulator [Gorillibacterium sp.]|nr:helix-turn-helix transcriptional regulator [Gorillibacterium sp.]
MSLFEHFHLPMTAGCSNTPINIGFHSHLEYEIYYFHTGKCHYIIGDKIHYLRPGDLILMNGMTLHCPIADPNSEYRRTVVHFDPQFVQGLLRPPFNLHLLRPFEELHNVCISLGPEEQSRIEPILTRMCQLFQQSDPLSHDRFLVQFLALLTELYEISTRPLVNKTISPGIKEQNVQRLISYLEQHYTEDIDLEEISHYMHLNKYHLVKIFKEITGITIFAFLYQRRINQAKVMLTLTPNKSITEIAYEVGFKYPSHFSRLFKAYTGSAPDTFRKKQSEWKDPFSGM